MQRRIIDLLAGAEKANSDSRTRWESGLSPRHEFMVADDLKELREQYFLGHFLIEYNREFNGPRLEFAEHLAEGDRPQPDFAVYDCAGDLHCYVEITEWLEHRQRDHEYSQPFRETECLVGRMPDPTDKLRNQVSKKLQEKAPHYPANTWLLIDDNVGRGVYPWTDNPLGDVEVARSVVDDLSGDMANVSQVWLLREVVRPMTIHRLHPR
jgi:hypothetical protein